MLGEGRTRSLTRKYTRYSRYLGPQVEVTHSQAVLVPLINGLPSSLNEGTNEGKLSPNAHLNGNLQGEIPVLFFILSDTGALVLNEPQNKTHCVRCEDCGCVCVWGGVS